VEVGVTASADVDAISHFLVVTLSPIIVAGVVYCAMLDNRFTTLSTAVVVSLFDHSNQ
jgi:hypothetical protein